ncbi:hypothetical protein K4F52_001926 [Lecanicillium sp. MT-2017a]|nr:hypothetical protein K4F52_001926 [Lecanicillium sp. MT-2017a]
MASTHNPSKTAVLSTARITLRPYTRADQDFFIGLFQDQDVCRYVADGKVGSPDDDKALFGRIFDPVYAQDRFAVWAVVTHGDDGQLIGHAELKPSPADDVEGWELVYVLAKSHWGRGLGTEIAGAVTRYGLDGDGLALGEVYATVNEGNAASIKLLGKLGYELLAVRPEEAFHVHIYRVSRTGFHG